MTGDVPRGMLPNAVPRLDRAGFNVRVQRDLEAFLKSVVAGIVATQGSEGLQLGIGATIGDMLVYDGERWQVLPVGSDGEVLTADSGEDLGVSWEAGGGNSVRVSVAFGGSFTDKAQTVVTGESWVTVNSNLSGIVLVPTGTDPDEFYLLNFKVVISDLVAGDGFTVTVYSEPEAKGTYEVMVIGV